MAELRLECGDVLECLKTYPDNHFDACLTDPPYGISFMSKRWDYDVPSVEVWAELLRVLKPGAYALIACGTRTQHRMVVNVEDAGFTVRDVITWLYGSGFPKSHNISAAIDKAAGAEREVVGTRTLKGNAAVSRKEKGGTYIAGASLTGVKEIDITAPATPEAQRWNGYGTALKPSVEFFTLVQKPLSGTYAQNALEWGVGGLNVDECRVETEDDLNGGAYAKTGERRDDGWGFQRAGAGEYKQPTGRFPANLLLDGSPEVLEHFPETSSGTRKSGTYRGMGYHGADEREYPDIEGNEGSAARFFKTCPPDGPEPQEDKKGRWPANLLHDNSPEVLEHFPETTSKQNKVSDGRTVSKAGDSLQMGKAGIRTPENSYSDEGSAARFFQSCPLDGPEPQPRVKYCAKASKRERNAGLEEPNTHPTLKPLSLTEYLARLILPPERDTPRRLINPYSGSGSEAIGAFHADWDEVTSIEREEEYIEIARARVSHHCGLYVDIKD